MEKLQGRLSMLTNPLSSLAKTQLRKVKQDSEYTGWNESSKVKQILGSTNIYWEVKDAGFSLYEGEGSK